PIGGEITVACESGIVTNTPKTAMEKALDEQMKSKSLLIKDYGGSEDVLLGELQFAFLPFRTRTQLFTMLLHHLCKDFISLMLDASSVDGHLLSWVRKLKELLENNLGWEF
ncbi:hypothetical protein CMV_026742, partial [Castanea mollissima]